MIGSVLFAIGSHLLRFKLYLTAVVGICIALLFLSTIPKYPSPLFTLVHDENVYSAAFSPDGRFIVTTSGGECGLYVWDATSGKQIKHLIGCPGDISWNASSLSYSPDGKWLAITRGDKDVWILDAQTGKVERKLVGHKGESVGTSYSPDGRFLVSFGSDNIGHVWNTKTGKEIWELMGHTHLISQASYSPDGHFIVTSSWDTTARVWSMNTGKELLRLSNHQGAVNQVSYSPDGRLIITASDDGTARIWDATNGRELHRFRVPGDWIRYAAFYKSNEKWVITVGWYAAEINKWDVNTAHVLSFFPAASSSTTLTNAIYDPQNSHLVTLTEKVAKVWDVK